MHLGQPREQELTAPVDPQPVRWDLHPVGRADCLDPTSANQHGLTRQGALAIHRDHGHVYDRYY
jgi:hypothetical protein